MKRTILATMIGTLCFALASPDVTSWALGGSGGGKLQSGDVNGDGNRSIGDAVYLLQYLFSGGPDPVESREPMAPPEVVAQILDAAARIEVSLPEMESATAASPVGTAIVDMIRTEILQLRETPEWTPSVVQHFGRRITFATMLASVLRSTRFDPSIFDRDDDGCSDLCSRAHSECRNSCGANATCIMRCDLALATCLLGCND